MRNEQLVRVATYAAVSVATTLFLLKLYAWWETGSVGVLASLVDSAVDIFASIIILFAVRLAQIPADNEHRFGHGKAEPLAALAQSMFIGGSAIYLVIYALQRLLTPVEVQEVMTGVWVMLVSMSFTLILISFQRYVIRKSQSVAIKADSLHYVSDLVVNFIIVVTLLLSAWQWLDPILGILIGVWLGWQAIRLGLSSANYLLDRELPVATKEIISQTILAHPKVKGFNDLRTYRSGSKLCIQLDLELDDDLKLVIAHEISEEVTQSLKLRFEDIDVMIHLEPVSVGRDKNHHQWEREHKI